MANVLIDKLTASRPTVNISSDAGGVGIQLPNRFNKKISQNYQGSPSPDFGDDGNFKDIMKDIANPNKTRADDDVSSISGHSSSNVDADYDGDGDLYSTESDSPGEIRPAKNYYDAEDQPSQGFLTIADEKADILFRLEVLRRQGIEPRKFSARDDIREMRAELNRIKTHLELDRSLKFSRKAVVGLSAALEFLNDKVDVLDLELDGWSDQMHQAVYTQKEYDTVFEELFFKYRGKVQTPPEIRLLLMFGASAMTFHMSNVMAKKVQKSLEGDDSTGSGFGEDIMKKLMGGLMGGAKAPGPQIQQPPPPQTQSSMEKPQFNDFFQNSLREKMMENANAQQSPPARKEMSPPSFSFPGFGMSPNAMPSPQNLMPVQSRGSDIMEMRYSDDDMSERLSDIPSDLESLPPSEFSSPTDTTVKVIAGGAPTRKPRAKGGKKNTPRIIEI
ncbi:hypothetical protein BST79_gp161 [Only Syngen Nebraska virus 5]|uniref:hypothetical protein n=1 Tax=Only Syngen Nebraska virus 5 TaxID=1917232 RepID=UPI0009014A06|nr:hypothetical protein BST79_gp161 [Only Syngen Nebraska virus 5]APC25674.1 hypothetical protein [Only Syngen Nebraska virus 5]